MEKQLHLPGEHNNRFDCDIKRQARTLTKWDIEKK